MNDASSSARAALDALRGHEAWAVDPAARLGRDR